MNIPVRISRGKWTPVITLPRAIKIAKKKEIYPSFLLYRNNIVAIAKDRVECPEGNDSYIPFSKTKGVIFSNRIKGLGISKIFFNILVINHATIGPEIWIRGFINFLFFIFNFHSNLLKYVININIKI